MPAWAAVLGSRKGQERVPDDAAPRRGRKQMQRRLFSWINTKMFFKLIFKNRGLVCQSEVAAAFFVWPVRDAVCAIKPPGRAAQKLVTRHKTRTRPVRVGDHRFEDCSPCLELRAEPSTTSSTRPLPHEAGPNRSAAHEATHDEPAAQRFLKARRGADDLQHLLTRWTY